MQRGGELADAGASAFEWSVTFSDGGPGQNRDIPILSVFLLNLKENNSEIDQDFGEILEWSLYIG